VYTGAVGHLSCRTQFMNVPMPPNYQMKVTASAGGLLSYGHADAGLLACVSSPRTAAYAGSLRGPCHTGVFMHVRERPSISVSVTIERALRQAGAEQVCKPGIVTKPEQL
jgi:hypothetical protein